MSETATEGNKPAAGFMGNIKARWLFFAVLGFVLILDLASKSWAEQNLTEAMVYTPSSSGKGWYQAVPWELTQPVPQAPEGDARIPALPEARPAPRDEAKPAPPSSRPKPPSGSTVEGGGRIKYVHDDSLGDDGKPFIPGVLHFKYAENFGAAFSIGSGGGHLLTLISLGVLGIVLWYTFRTPARRWFVLLCLGLITGGAVGNIYDRFTHHTVDDFAWRDSPKEVVVTPAVRDFLYWPFSIPLYSTVGLDDGEPPRKWPIFNIADMGIVGGVIGVIFVIAFSPSPVGRREDEA